MALRGVQIAVAIAIITTSFLAIASAQSSCTPVIMSLMPCLSYITGNSSTPSSSCCTQLSSVVGSQPQCLCTLLNGGASSLGLTINQAQALSLPSACKIQTPPVSQCKTAAAAGPAQAPLASGPESPSGPATKAAASPTPSISSGQGSKATPVGQSSGGSSTAMSLTLLLSLLFVGSYVSDPTSAKA